MWNGLAMDLMMSNLESPKWMWSDTNALPLLNYWRSLDEKIGFVLVYNSPAKYIENLFESQQLSSSDEIENALNEWHNYNRLLLNYFYNNQDVAILVNSEQVQQNSTKYLNEIKKQISLEEYVPQGTTEVSKETKSSSSIIYNYLVEQIVNRDEKTQMLYLEMESTANLPLDANEIEASMSLNDLLNTYINEREKYGKLSLELQEKQSAYNQLKKQKESLNNILKQENQKLKDTQDENELILVQLMNVQEELEKSYLAQKSFESKIEELSLQLEVEKTNTNKARSHKNYLKNKLQKELLKEQQENELLLQQVMDVQEEFEKIFLQKKSLEERFKRIALNLENEKINAVKAQSHTNYLKTQFEKKLGESKKELEKYIRENSEFKKKKQYFGAEERIKQQLSYKLGEKLVELGHVWYGPFVAPFSFYKVTKKHKKEPKAYSHLPPVELYSDFHEAEKLKRYLPYKFGQTIANRQRSVWGMFTLPFTLISTYTKHREERRNVSQ